MDRKFKIRTNLLICVIILAGFAAVAITSYNTYSRIIADDIINISRLTSTNIYSEIHNELTKPIFVSLTMANDSFLKKWLKNEQAQNTPEHGEEMQQYLQALKMKYGYDSVFLVSEATKTYYHFNGVNKVICESDAHDVWYYTFRDSGLTYDLDVDTDEANHNQLSVFVNCRMTDEDGNLIGVTGVGLVLTQVQSLMKSFEDEYGLEATLFSADGTVQVNTQSDNAETMNVFDNVLLAKDRQAVISNLNTMQIFAYEEKPFDGYYITRYVEELGWYLLIKKDTSVLEGSMYSQTISDAVIYALVAACVLYITNRIIRKNDALLMKMTRMDLLTGLPNRRGFNESLEKAMAAAPDRGPLYVFVFDIDNFKEVNDTFGHLTGDEVLRIVGRLAAEAFSAQGAVYRWGGDEFAGYGFGTRTAMKAVLDWFLQSINKEPELEQFKTTVTMGVACAGEHDSANTLIWRADQALYEGKGSGKNRYHIKTAGKPE